MWVTAVSKKKVNQEREPSFAYETLEIRLDTGKFAPDTMKQVHEV